MSLSYTQRRAKRVYAQGREQAPSIHTFRYLSKLLFVSSMLLTLLSYWFDSDILLRPFDTSLMMKVAGALIVLIGYLSLSCTFKQLGSHYSPLFDAFLPKALVMNGIYRYIRHPIYLFNLFVSFGLALSSGSVLVLLMAVTGFVYIVRTIILEEEYLQRHFSEYEHYMKRSWRLVPFLY